MRTDGKIKDGWLDTGDLASVDGDGFIRLAGRAKDLIIRGGHNIDPATIEDALMEHPDVTAAAAVGRPDPHAGEVPVAFVTVAAGSRLTPDELEAWAAEHVPSVPRRPGTSRSSTRSHSLRSASRTSRNCAGARRNRRREPRSPRQA